MKFENWLYNLKQAKPELSQNIEKLERFFEDGIFQASKFETAVLAGVSHADEKIKRSLFEVENAED
jgi:hypothetical protein